MPETVARRRPLSDLEAPPATLDAPGEPTAAFVERAQWNSRIGFVLAAVGSAVGFGSIARFPMNAANNGGAAFVLLYAGLMLLFGIPLMIAEFSIGRSAQSNTVGSFKRLTGNTRTHWRYAGMLYFLVAAFFLSWYSAVTGWVLRYALISPAGTYFSDPTGYFATAQEGPWTLFFHAVVLVLTLIVVTGKVSKGIERLNLVLMPSLFLIVVGLAIYAVFLGGAAEGYRFYLTPDFTAISLGVVTAAVGQAFFSLSLGQGAMMTYASYLPREASLAGNALLVSISTLSFAFIAGLMVFPMLSAFGLLGTGQAGLGLIFGPLPSAFAAMGSPFGQIVGTLFFSAAFFAAFTSAVSLTEPAIAYVSEEWRVPRKKAALLVVLCIYTAGILPALDVDVLTLEGGAMTDFFVLLGGLLIALFVGWKTPMRVARERLDSGVGLRLGPVVYPVVRWVLPVVLTFLLFFAVTGTPCALSGGSASPGMLGELFGWSPLGCTG